MASTDRPTCGACGAAIYRERATDGLVKLSCGCRTEHLKVGEPLPEVWEGTSWRVESYREYRKWRSATESLGTLEPQVPNRPPSDRHFWLGLLAGLLLSTAFWLLVVVILAAA